MGDLLRATSKVPKHFRFGRRPIAPGEEFVCDSDRMTRTLVEIGYAELIEPEVDTPPPPRVEMKVIDYRTPSLPSSDVVVASQPPRKRGRPRKNEYQTRVLRAEE